MTQQANSGGYPGVIADPDHEDSLIVANNLTSGSPNDDTVDSKQTFWGSSYFSDSAGSAILDQPVLAIEQEYTPPDDGAPPALNVLRDFALGGHTVSSPTVMVSDQSGSTADLQQWSNGSGTVARVNQAGGIGRYGVAPNATRPTRTIQTSTITDVAALAAIHALIGVINGTGDALITET